MDEQVELLLKQLRLPAFVQHYQAVWDEAAKQGWSHPQYLTCLCEKEVADRYQRRVHNWTKEAKFPRGKSFATLDLDELDSQSKSQLIRLKQDTDWVTTADNVLLIGPSGVGKTHIAVAIGHQLIEHGYRCKFLPAVALVQHLQQAKRDLELMAAMTKLDRFRLIIIDDIGYVRKTDAETQVLFEFIAHRYESGSLLITANQPFSKWDHIFPDNMMTVAAVDRLIHHAAIINPKGESYRKKHQTQNP
jgi:DNA replication protein DnaC|tara:strand:- start:229 stop:969 length:741 start_codon:yes stop_codon:yes gene_type:complete